jgi:hypothetical protein
MQDPILKGVSHKMDWDILAQSSDLGPSYVRWCLVLNSELLEFTLKLNFWSAFRIRDILVRMRIPDPRIRTVPLTNG